jgi:hypothetical protein
MPDSESVFFVKNLCLNITGEVVTIQIVSSLAHELFA